MATDLLVLGGIKFTDFEAPERMPFGGAQAMSIHKLPGGSRVIDTLGPDDEDFTWSGFFYGDNAYNKALSLDDLRSAGLPVNLIWGGNSWLVIVSSVSLEVQRFPQYIHYSVTVVVAQNNMRGERGVIHAGIDVLIRSDMSTALALAGL